MIDLSCHFNRYIISSKSNENINELIVRIFLVKLNNHNFQIYIKFIFNYYKSKILNLKL